jgi:hypothetical protein
METAEIVWQDPPARNAGAAGRERKWVTVLAPLLERPGQWARVLALPDPKRANGVAGSIKKAAGLEREQWQVVSRGGEVYARYLGENGNGHGNGHGE